MKKYFNGHAHTYYSNTTTPDVIISPLELVNRTLELGHTAITATEHGNTLSKYELYELAQKNGLKYIYGVEAYFVIDSQEKDSSNGHIVIYAINDNGYKQINEIISHANTNGFYYKPRIDLKDIEKLNENDVIITTACFIEGTQVKTKDGMKKIEDIKTGEYVLTHNNSWKKVIMPTNREYTEDLINIRIGKTNREITCTKNHKFLIQKNNNVEWKEAQYLTNNDVLLTPNEEIEYKNIDYFNFKKVISYKDSMNRKYKKQINTKIKITDELMMMFGLWLADGHMNVIKGAYRVGFTFNINEFENLYNKIIKKAFDQFGIEPYILRREKNNRVDVTYTSKQIYEVFDYLFDNRKADSKRVSNKIRDISLRFNQAILYGYLLGDGYFRTRDSGGEVISCTISKDLNLDIIDLYKQCNIFPSERIVKESIDSNGVKHKESFYLSVFSKNLGNNNKINFKSLNDFIYDLSNVKSSELFTTLNNKKYIIRKIQNISTIKNSSSIKVYCLNVEEDHSFECEGVIVHNCIGSFLNKDRTKTNFLIDNFERFRKNGNFFLEVAYHDTDKQKEYNEFLLKLSIEKTIPLIFGADTHIIEVEDSKYRDAFLLSKGISYEDEYGWMIDFPSRDEAFMRFKNQGILSDDLINQCIDNTLLVEDKVVGYEILKDKSMKLPIIKSMRKFSQDSRDKEFVDIVWKEYPKKIKNLSIEEDIKYRKQIEFEIDEILGCGMADYFIFNYNMIKLGKEKYNGVLTYSGRGSSASYLICMILGFTTIDRNKYSVPILPERFITKDRILLSKTPPDKL